MAKSTEMDSFLWFTRDRDEAEFGLFGCREWLLSADKSDVVSIIADQPLQRERRERGLMSWDDCREDRG